MLVSISFRHITESDTDLLSGSGIYAKKGEKESFVYRFYGALDYNLDKYGDKSITMEKVRFPLLITY